MSSARTAHRIPREFNLPVRLSALARKRYLCWSTLAVGLVLARVALLPLLPIPAPVYHDEFSYLLAGDTFAHGRVVYPTPVEPEFFESPQILVRPVYASKYPPGQGVILALGENFLGNAYWGVVLSNAAMIFLFCWAADAWLPPNWTLVLGGLAWILFFVRHYWFTTYWGGSLAACGGALVIGGLGHLLRSRPLRGRWGLVLGAVILLFTRPFEGGVFCAVVLAVLTVRFARLRSPDRRVLLKQVALPGALALLAAGTVAGWYNAQITGHATRFPWTLYMNQYALAPPFWILPELPPKPPCANCENSNLRKLNEFDLEVYRKIHRPPPYVAFAIRVLLTLTSAVWEQFLAFGLLLIALPWARLRGKPWLLPVVGIPLAALTLNIWQFPHYSAPLTAALLIAIVASMRALWYRMAASRFRGPLFVAALGILAASVLVDYLSVLQTPRTTPRAALIRQLTAQGGRHLVLVDYSENWEPWAPNGEWVYNGADLASSTVLFAHLRGDRENQQLFHAYPGRTAWLLRLGPDPSAVHLEPYTSAGPPDQARR